LDNGKKILMQQQDEEMVESAMSLAMVRACMSYGTPEPRTLKTIGMPLPFSK
jgi:hypothetical protein